MSVTFRVDDVEPARTPPATRSLQDHLGADSLALGGDPTRRGLATTSSQSLLGAIHHAFAEHRPLILTPDAVWLTIAQGVARHVQLHPATLRERLGVRHTGRARIDIEIPTFGPASATDLVSTLRSDLGDRIGAGRARLFVCDFSTTTDVERIASEIVLLDLYSTYFDFFAAIICGIPEITLLGAPADWRKIRERIDLLEELDLSFWTSSLRPIADAFVAASEGRPDIAHFQSIYKPRRAYGWDRITGWAARLYPYVGCYGRFTERNPLLELPFGEPLPDGSESDWYAGPGIRLQDIPAGGSQVLVRMRDTTRDTSWNVTLDGGVLAVAVDDEDRLTPCVAWVARRGAVSVQDVIERIRADHSWAPPIADEHRGGYADITALYDAFASATLFGGKLRLRARSELETILMPVLEDTHVVLTRYADFDDGTFLAVTHSDDKQCVVVRMREDRLGAPRESDLGHLSDEAHPSTHGTSERAPEVAVIATSFTAVIAEVLRTSGSPSFPPLGSLHDTIPPWIRIPRPPRPPKGG